MLRPPSKKLYHPKQDFPLLTIALIQKRIKNIFITKMLRRALKTFLFAENASGRL
jgi:hypothetical protein